MEKLWSTNHPKSIDKSLIDAVIKRNMNQLNTAIHVNSSKSITCGKIVVKFVIAKDGSVSKADIKTSTMGSPAVEGCIKSRFRKFKFPEPKREEVLLLLPILSSSTQAS